MTEVTVQYVDDCPNWRAAAANVRAALAALSRTDVAVTSLRVATAAQAEALGFPGSPTVLVDGRDPFAEHATPPGLSCRMYRTGDGYAGAPTVEQLVAVLDHPRPSAST